MRGKAETETGGHDTVQSRTAQPMCRRGLQSLETTSGKQVLTTVLSLGTDID